MEKILQDRRAAKYPSPQIYHLLLDPFDDILKQKREIRNKEGNKKSTVKYLPHWPFVVLRVEGETTARKPNVAKSVIVGNFLKKRAEYKWKEIHL